MKIRLFCLILFLSLAFPASVEAYYTNMPASIVVGQPDFTSNSSGITDSTLSNPIGSFSDGKRLFVADISNHRVLIWNTIPTRNGTPADIVLGQPDFTSNTINNGGVSARTMDSPTHLFSDGTHLAVVDSAQNKNDRVLIWNSIPTTNFQPADVVVGQPDFTTTSSALAANKFAGVFGVSIYNGKLIVSNVNGRRVLIFNSIPTTNGASADVVVGQDDFTSNVSGTTANRFFGGARVVVVKNNKLIVEDTHRIMIWNTLPTTNGAYADIILGQPDFTTGTADIGGISCSSLNSPEGIAITDSGRLIVGDTSRVLIWNTFPTANFQSADVVLGQPGCTTRTNNYGGLSASSLGANGNTRVFIQGNQLFVSDSPNNRILVFNNVLSGPQLSMNTPEQIDNSRLKVTGNVLLGERSRYALQTMKANVNGQGFGNVISLGGGTDDGTDKTRYEFFHEFEPWAGISAKDQYSPSTGYTLNLKASSFNAEEDNIFYFQPFAIKSINGNQMTLNINKDHWDRIKNNLDSYEIQQKKGTTWTTLLDKIPLNSESITSTKSLSGEIRLVAKDKWGHKQETNSLLISSGFSSYNPNFKFATTGFPLQINRITGVNSGIISTYMSLPKTSFTSSATRPTFSGIAYSGSQVTVLVTDPVIGRSQTFTTITAANSMWQIKPTLYNSSIIDVWVTDSANRYSELPAFKLTVLRSEQ